MTTIDLNADIGESFGSYKIGNDDELLQIVSSANIACGFHGGDPDIMDRTIQTAIKYGVRMGAHPGFDDIAGFGRRIIRGNSERELSNMILYQIGAFQAMAKANNGTMAYVKLHGALSNLAMAERPFADAFIDAMTRGKIDKPVMAMPLSEVEASAKLSNVPIIFEAFADRNYLSNGMLAPRSHESALIQDPKIATERAMRMIESGEIVTVDGSTLNVKIDSICIHGDNPSALKIAQQIRTGLEQEGVKITAPHNAEAEDQNG